VKSAQKQATWASTSRRSPRMSTSLVILAMVFVLVKGSMLGGTNLVSYLTTTTRWYGDSCKTPVQESVRSIFTVFKQKAPKSTEGSPPGVGKDKKPSAAKNFSLKFSRRVKNATPTMTSSLVAPVT
jgi:hypothetical protein